MPHVDGADFEYYVAEVFWENGHHAAVTKASGDFGVDIVLNGRIAVQVKKYASPVGPSAVQEVVAGMAIYGCDEAWVVTSSTFTQAALSLAQANRVRLIAGEELSWMAANPDRSADHRARYGAYLVEVEAKQREARLEERFAGDERLKEIAKVNWNHAVKIEQVALWKARREIEIPVGMRSGFDELCLETAAKMLADASYTLPEDGPRKSYDAAVAEAAIAEARAVDAVAIVARASAAAAQAAIESEAGQPNRPISFNRLLANERARRESTCVHDNSVAEPRGASIAQVPNPPAAWYPDPGGQSCLRWWDGTQWTAALYP